ncbi:hypothetical protein ACFW2V_12505 [Streptomyces sp. NPDC058947]|uniref:hypothetical protein n=1 Tax=Streptomyces sp. NPDC058947 TaxID=3346675 RepID=UPI0036BD94B5
MSERDRRLAKKFEAKGMKSANQTNAERMARRGGSSDGASGGAVEALRNFDPARPKETAVPRDEASVRRARSHKFGLPGLG